MFHPFRWSPVLRSPLRGRCIERILRHSKIVSFHASRLLTSHISHSLHVTITIHKLTWHCRRRFSMHSTCLLPFYLRSIEFDVRVRVATREAYWLLLLSCYLPPADFKFKIKKSTSSNVKRKSRREFNTWFSLWPTAMERTYKRTILVPFTGLESLNLDPEEGAGRARLPHRCE